MVKTYPAQPGDSNFVRKANSKKQQKKFAKATTVSANALAAKDKSTVTGKPLTKSQKQAVATAEKRSDAKWAYRTPTGENYAYTENKLGAQKFADTSGKIPAGGIPASAKRKVARATNPGPKAGFTRLAKKK